MNQPPTVMDVLRSARLLAGRRQAALEGGELPAAPRPVIGESWHRVRQTGVDPDHGNAGKPISTEEVEHRRRSSPLMELMPLLRDGLASMAYTDSHLMIVTDAEGRVLWRDGDMAVRRSADRFGISQGSLWAEEVIGTNAIGTALVTRRPVQVHSAEHFVRALHWLTCSAAPLQDPRDGRLLGVVTVTGPAATLHPAAPALVTAVARVAEGELRTRHWEGVGRLRAIAAPALARLGGRALAVDRNGWTAATTGMAPPDRVALPKSPQAGEVWLPSLGMCVLEPLPGGWLVRVGPDEPPAGAAGRVVLDMTLARSWAVTVSGPSGSWTQELTPRHAELLFVLAVHRGGRTAAQLAQDLFGEPGRTVTIRAEMSRLRRNLAGVLAHRPYRFTDTVDVELRLPVRALDLLPHSTAPAVLAARAARS